jgi:hypothetical protein
MRWMVMLAMLLVARGAAAQPEVQYRILREIYLGVPLPGEETGGLLAEELAEQWTTRDHRLEALGIADADEQLVMDYANGYLSMPVGGRSNHTLHIVLKYFDRADGDRLVVMQIIDDDTPSGVVLSEDFAWTQSRDGRFTEHGIRDLLPEIEFADFWPNESEDDVFPIDVVSRQDYHVLWPREGTTAVFRVVPPPYGDDETHPGRMETRELYKRRTHTAMELMWNAREGRFTQGALTPYTGAAEQDRPDWRG